MHELYVKWLGMIDFPAIILLMITLMGGFVMYKTQASKSNNFDFADMLRDDGGKPSAFRLGIFICLAISSWAVMYLVIQNKAIDVWVIVLYMLIWSGAKIADKIVDAYLSSKSDKGPPPPSPPAP
jgi:hypothetical protein